jgi:chromosome segregation ATPase
MSEFPTDLAETIRTIRDLRNELKAAYVNLTATQERCTALLEETRALRVERDEANAMKDAAGQKAWQLQEELQKLRDRFW